MQFHLPSRQDKWESRCFFPVPVPLSLILISLIWAGKSHSMTWGKIACVRVSKALTLFGCLDYLPLKVLLPCENLFYAILQWGILLSLLNIACNTRSYCFATFWSEAIFPFFSYRSEVKARQDVKPDIRQPPFTDYRQSSTDYRQPPLDYRHPPVMDYQQPPPLDYRQPPLMDYRQHSPDTRQYPLSEYRQPQVRTEILTALLNRKR